MPHYNSAVTVIPIDVETEPLASEGQSKCYFAATIEKMVKGKLVPKDVLDLQVIDGKLRVKCTACSLIGKNPKLIDPGCKTKALSNVKAHLKTPLHSKNVAAYLEGIQKKLANTVESHKSEVGHKIKEVNLKYQGRFELLELSNFKQGDEKVRCTICNQVFCLFPQRGSLINNLDAYLKLHNTTELPKKRKQASIESFIVKKQPKL